MRLTLASYESKWGQPKTLEALQDFDFTLTLVACHELNDLGQRTRCGAAYALESKCADEPVILFRG
jgi:hypothetical protein